MAEDTESSFPRRTIPWRCAETDIFFYIFSYQIQTLHSSRATAISVGQLHVRADEVGFNELP
jgi:hypothetical protein